MPINNDDFILFRDYSEPAFMIDTEGKILDANSCFLNRFLTENEDARGKNVFDLISDVFHEPELSVTRKAMVDKVVSSGQYHICDDESLGRVLRNFIYPIKTPEGKTTRLLIVVHDITAQVAAEKQARKTEGVYKALIDAIPGSVFVLDKESLIHSSNDFAIELFSDHTGKIQHNDFFDLIFEEDRENLKEKLTELFNSGFIEADEVRMHTHGNRKRYDWFSINAQRAVIGTNEYLVLVCIDISRQKHDEARLIGYRKWMVMAMESGNTGLWDWNVKTDEALWSNKIWDLYGIKKVSGQHPSFKLWETSVHPDDKEAVIGALKQAVKLLADLNIEYRVVHPNGSISWVLVNGKPVFNSRGEAHRYCGIVIDITDQKQLGEEIHLTRELLNQALEKLHIGWFHTNLKDYSTIRTLEHARIFGYDTMNSDWSLSEFFKHIDDEDRERVQKQLFDSIANHKDFIVECQIRKADGEKRRIWASASLQYDKDGNVTHILGIIQDVTDRLS